MLKHSQSLNACCVRLLRMSKTTHSNCIATLTLLTHSPQMNHIVKYKPLDLE